MGLFSRKRKNVDVSLREARGRRNRKGVRGNPRHYFIVEVDGQRFTVYPSGQDKCRLDAAKASTVLLGGNYVKE